MRLPPAHCFFNEIMAGGNTISKGFMLQSFVLQNLKDLEGKYKGETIHVFACGPSLLKNVAKRDWMGKTTIGVNGSFEVVNNLSYWLRIDPFSESDADKRQVEWLKKSSITKRLLNSSIKFDDTWNFDYQFRKSMQYPSAGGAIDGVGFWWCGTSVHAAIELAGHMGASEIVVWGLDYDNQEHAYPDNGQRNPYNLQRIEDGFQTLVKYWYPYTKIVNANPESKLKALPFINPLLYLPYAYRDDKTIDVTPRKPNNKPLVIVLTATGDRPECIQRCEKYFQRATKPEKYDVKWLVVDNGTKPIEDLISPDLYIRNDKNCTLANQMFVGLNIALRAGAKYILIQEDDDWYAVDNIVRRVAALEKEGVKLHGYTKSIYYNVYYRAWQQTQNERHSSLHDTSFNAEVASIFANICMDDKNKDNPYLDLLLWAEIKDGKKLEGCSDNQRAVVSLKGFSGRKGLGMGHNAVSVRRFKKDPDGIQLAFFIGIEDAKEILDSMLIKKTEKLDKEVPLETIGK